MHVQGIDKLDTALKSLVYSAYMFEEEFGFEANAPLLFICIYWHLKKKKRKQEKKKKKMP